MRANIIAVLVAATLSTASAGCAATRGGRTAQGLVMLAAGAAIGAHAMHQSDCGHRCWGEGSVMVLGSTLAVAGAVELLMAARTDPSPPPPPDGGLSR